MSSTQANQIIVKAYYNDLVESQPEIRRFAIDVTPSTNVYETLETTVAQLNSNYEQGQFALQYIDEDNDRITFSSDIELRSALRQVSSGAIMKIYVKPKAKKSESSNANATVHPGVTCDGCQGSIVGNRYKCVECPDFDLCQSCSEKNLHPEHNMLKMTRPGQHPCGGFRRGGRGFFGPGPRGFPGAGRCGGGGFGGPRFWRHFMQQQQQQQAGGACGFQMPPDMANFLGQFKGKELAELIEAHLPEYLRTEKITEMLNQFKTGEQADKPVDHNHLLENVGKFLREVLSPFGIDCDYFVDSQQAEKSAGQAETKEKSEEPAAAATGHGSSTEPKPTAPPASETASAPAPGAASFGNLLEQLQTMFTPVFQAAANSKGSTAPTTTTTTSAVDQEAQEQKKIEECIERMTAMGFVDSNGILTGLIKAKKGDLNQVLDALNPRNYKN